MKARVQELSIEIENGNEKINSNLADLVRKQKEFHLWVTADSKADEQTSLDRIEDIISTDLETDEMMKLFNRTSEVLEVILKSQSGQNFKTSAGKTLLIGDINFDTLDQIVWYYSDDSPTINRISKAETFNGFDSNSSNKSMCNETK